MDVQTLFGPMFAAALFGLCAFGWATGRIRADRVGASIRWAFYWFLAVGAAYLATRWLGRREAEILVRALMGTAAVGALAWAAWLLYAATRWRRWAERLSSATPVPLDEAARCLEAADGALGAVGVFEGRLGAVEQVTSPGGVVGAFFRAELREVREDGEKGALVAFERGQAAHVYLAGEATRARLALDDSHEAVFAPLSVRRCESARWPTAGGEVVMAVAGGVGERLSFERVGKLGAHCLVAGRLLRSAPGRFRLTGEGAAPLVIAVTEDGRVPARALVKRARRGFVGAVALTGVMAFCLSHLVG